MKKIFFSLFFIALFMFPALADYTVDSVNVSAEVAASGRTEVTSSFQLTFLDVQEEISIPLPEGDISGISVSSYRYSTRETENGISLVVKNSKGFSGTQVFVVSYKLPAFQADGSDEDLYSLGLLSSRWAREIGALSVQLSLPGSTVEYPEGYTMEPQLLSGYYGDLDPVEAALEANGNMISGSVSGLMAYDTMTLQVSLPDGYFRVRSNTIPMISVTWWFLSMAGVLVLCAIYWRLKLRNKGREITARLLLPEGILSYQLPAVLDGKTIDFAALVLEWANLGYLSLGYNKHHQLVLRKTMDMGSERNAAEQRLFRTLLGRRRKITATPGRFAAPAARFRAAALRPVSRTAFDKTSGNVVLIQLPCRLLPAVGIGYMVSCMLPEEGAFLILAVLAGVVGLLYSIKLHSALAAMKSLRQFSLKTGVLLAMAVVLVVLGLMYGAFLEVTVGLGACCFSALATASGPRRNSHGQELMAQAKGCRRFYRQVAWQRLQIYTSGNRRFFQRELPQTVALRSEKVFAQRFERLSVPYPEWLPAKNTGYVSPEQLLELLEPMIKALWDAF